MPRGQYDRAAARLRKSLPTQQAYNEMMSERMHEIMSEPAQEPVRANRTISDLEHQLAEALEKVDKLQRLCNTHGLWVE
jgi:hypothetical protein